MKISEYIESIEDKYRWKLKIVKKWIFRILLDEDAYFMSKMFYLKLTKLDKETIKVWFPDWAKNKWLKILEEKNISYVLFEKKDNSYKRVWLYKWISISKIYKIDMEDYLLLKNRILKLNKLWIEEKNQKNFILKDRLEEVYILLSQQMIKMPKKERYYFRDKIEKLFMDLLQFVYEFMYNLENRKLLIKQIFNKVMILREFTRFLYKIWKIRNDNVYLDLWDRWIEILKICKWIMSKY